MATLFASVAMSGAEDTPKERAERELQKETDDNTVQAAKESPEMRQFRLDLSEGIKRTECHKKEETREGGGNGTRGQKGQYKHADGDLPRDDKLGSNVSGSETAASRTRGRRGKRSSAGGLY